jgi:hypothetical protein
VKYSVDAGNTHRGNVNKFFLFRMSALVLFFARFG